MDEELIEYIVYLIFDRKVDLNNPSETIKQIKEKILEDINSFDNIEIV